MKKKLLPNEVGRLLYGTATTLAKYEGCEEAPFESPLASKAIPFGKGGGRFGTPYM